MCRARECSFSRRSKLTLNHMQVLGMSPSAHDAAASALATPSQSTPSQQGRPPSAALRILFAPSDAGRSASADAAGPPSSRHGDSAFAAPKAACPPSTTDPSSAPGAGSLAAPASVESSAEAIPPPQEEEPRGTRGSSLVARWSSRLLSSAGAGAPKAPLRPLDLLAAWRSDSSGAGRAEEEAGESRRAAAVAAVARKSRLGTSPRWRALWPAGESKPGRTASRGRAAGPETLSQAQVRCRPGGFVDPCILLVIAPPDVWACLVGPPLPATCGVRAACMTSIASIRV